MNIPQPHQLQQNVGDSQFRYFQQYSSPLPSPSTFLSASLPPSPSPFPSPSPSLPLPLPLSPSPSPPSSPAQPNLGGHGSSLSLDELENWQQFAHKNSPIHLRNPSRVSAPSHYSDSGSLSPPQEPVHPLFSCSSPSSPSSPLSPEPDSLLLGRSSPVLKISSGAAPPPQPSPHSDLLLNSSSGPGLPPRTRCLKTFANKQAYVKNFISGGLSDLTDATRVDAQVLRSLEKVSFDVRFQQYGIEGMEYCFSYEKSSGSDEKVSTTKKVPLNDSVPHKKDLRAHETLYMSLTSFISNRTLNHLMDRVYPTYRSHVESLKIAIRQYLTDYLPIHYLAGLDGAWIDPLALVKLVIQMAKWEDIPGRMTRIVYFVRDGGVATQTFVVFLQVSFSFLPLSFSIFLILFSIGHFSWRDRALFEENLSCGFVSWGR